VATIVGHWRPGAASQPLWSSMIVVYRETQKDEIRSLTGSAEPISLVMDLKGQ
jgi:hypothetical protein